MYKRWTLAHIFIYIYCTFPYSFKCTRTNVCTSCDEVYVSMKVSTWKIALASLPFLLLFNSNSAAMKDAIRLQGMASIHSCVRVSMCGREKLYVC